MKNTRYLNGYKLLYRPDHFNSMKGDNWDGYVYEHRFVMESDLGRSLSSEELVHHLDCNKLNNHIGNLIIVDRSSHVKIHGWIDSGAHIHESYVGNGVNSWKTKVPELKSCPICDATIPVVLKTFCSIECANIHKNTVGRKVERPSHETLLLDLSTMSYKAVGRKYGVSDNSIRKWLKFYTKSIMSQAESTLSEGAETSGEIQIS